MFFAMGATLSFGGEGAVDIHRADKTMVTWSPSPIRSFGPSGPPPTAYNLRSAASSLSGLLRGCSSIVASPMPISMTRCVQH
jgi:hypothetical protein